MGCSNGKTFEEKEPGLDHYYVRAKISPKEAQQPMIHSSRCRSTKTSASEEKEPERKWIRSVSVMDTRCSLTTREKFQIIKSWKGITRNLGSTGINMFLRLFELHEDLRPFFNIYDNDKDMLEIRQNNKFMDHVILVMHTLDEAITTLGDIEYVQEMLRGVGRSHKQLRGFNFLIFERIEEPFIFAVKETLGDRFSANIENIYRKTIKFITKELAGGFNEPL